MTERWRRALGRLDREEPDERALHARADEGPRMPEPSASTASRVVAAAVALLLAVGGTTLAVRAFRADGSGPTTGSIDPVAVCGFTPRHGPEYVSLDSHEIPQAVLDEPGTPFADLSSEVLGDPLGDPLPWPSIQAVQEIVGNSQLPADGWRVIEQSLDGVTAAAPGEGDHWYVLSIDRRDGDPRVGGWAPSTPVVPTAADRGAGLRLEWDGPIEYRHGSHRGSLSLVNDRTQDWVDDGGEYWAVAHVFDRSTGAEVALDGDSVIAGVGGEYDLAPGGRVDVPVALPSGMRSLPVGDYDLVACIRELSLESPVGTLRVLGDETAEPSTAEAPEVTILVAKPQNDSMAALGEGTLTVVDGCLALGGSSEAPTFVIWPAGSGLTERDGQTWVTDPNGEATVKVGDAVRLGGGLVGLSQAEELVDGEIPESCKVSGERYFLTGEFLLDLLSPAPGTVAVSDPLGYEFIMPASWFAQDIDGFDGRTTTQGTVVSSVPLPRPSGAEILPDLSALPSGEVVLAILHSEGGAYQPPGPDTPSPLRWEDFQAIPTDAGFELSQTFTLGGTTYNLLIGGLGDGPTAHEADLRAIVASIRPAL